MKALAVFLFLAPLVLGQNPATDIITSLVTPAVNFKQYAGYSVVDPSHGRTLFYWFVESQANPSTDPLVLWLNGGPGCSSLGGFLSENGPFWVNTDGATLRLNPSAWNKVANVIYLESPSGVGFSYSNTTSDYVTGDNQTAWDAVAFLHNFLNGYPSYQGRTFWISGESYAGHYVPTLAQAIIQANNAKQTPFINLGGFQVGNAWTNASADNTGAVEFWWSHALISDETYNGFMASCNFSNIGPLSESEAKVMAPDPIICDQMQLQADKDMADINIYQIYFDVCLQDKLNQGSKLVNLLAEANPVGPFRKNMFQSHKKPSDGRVGDQEPDMDPCVDDHMTSYLNQPQVQSAIHARPTSWSDCNNPVQYSRNDLLTSMIPVYQWLLNNSNIRMLVYSGDVDGIVPVTGTRNWMRGMNMTIIDTWRPWIDSQDQTGGWTQAYLWGSNPAGLTFATVRDAGHMVPWGQPGRSFDLFSRFLTGQRI